MNIKIKQHLIDHCKKNGLKIDENRLIEILLDKQPIYRETIERYRLFDIERRVVNVDGMLLQYDSLVKDVGLDHHLDTVVEVTKKQKLTDYYEEMCNDI